MKLRIKNPLVVVNNYRNNNYPSWPNGCQSSSEKMSAGYIGSDDYDSGEEFIRLSPVTKSNHIDATPWAFVKKEITPSTGQLTIYSGDASTPASNCGVDFNTQIRVAATAASPVRNSELRLPVLSKDEMEKVNSLSILKAQASLRKASSNLPMLFAERRATLMTLKKYSTFILNNVITMQRKDVKRWLDAKRRHKRRKDILKNIARDISNNHLEFVFGVLPVIDDMIGLTELVTEERWDIVTGRGRHTLAKPVIRKGVWPMQYSRAAFSVVKTTTERYSVRTGLRFDIDSKVAHAARRLGFNPLYNLYDMTPMSFVVGWFSNFNHWLQSLDPLVGVTWRTGYSTQRRETRIHVRGSPVSSSKGSNRTWGSGSFEHSGSIIDQSRIVHGKMPDIQSLYFVDNASFFAAVASLSLATQRLVKEARREIKRKEFRYRGTRTNYLPPIRYVKP